MDDRLRIIQHLYDEDVDDPSALRRITEEEDLRQEYEELRSTKNLLDRRSSPSPDPEVVDRVVDHAAEAGSSTRARRAPDRDSRRWERTVSGRIRTISAVLTLLLFVGLGWWQFETSDAPPVGRSTPDGRESVTATSEEQRTSESIPDWNDRDEVVRLHRRVEQLRTRSQAGVWENELESVDQGHP